MTPSYTPRTLLTLILTSGLYACVPEGAVDFGDGNTPRVMPDSSQDMTSNTTHDSGHTTPIYTDPNPDPEPDPTQDMAPAPQIDMNTPPVEPVDMSTEPPPPVDMGPPAPTCDTITSCQAGDGCCPSGCDALSDSDCEADCTDPDTWPDNWAQWEADVITEVNKLRAQGVSCGFRGSFSPTHPVEMNRELQIAARCHSVDMVEHAKLSHTGSDGSNFSERANRAGYTGRARGENIAAGQNSPASVTSSWRNSDGHCANLMSPDIDRMGIGYFTGDVRYTHYWTMVTGVGD